MLLRHDPKLASGFNCLRRLRVLRNVERIVREEMDRAVAIEMLSPSIHATLEETGRWKFGASC